jgi:putative DNA primase/helicase
VDTKGEPSLEMAALLQEWFGYCLVPDTRAQTSMWWLGGGANGKGIATKILESLIGEKQRVGLDIENLHEGYHRASLYGKLLAIVSEIAPRAMVRSGSWFKAIVAGDTISARQIGKDVFSFAPTARVLVTANELPKTYDRTFGYFRRLKLLFFRVDLAEEKQDRDLLDKLMVELPGIFNWALIGLYRLQAQRMKFSKSEDAEQELASYRYEQDPVARFVDDWCQRDAGEEEQTSELWEAFGRWCKTNGEVPGNSVSFHRALSRLGFEAALRWDAAKGTNNRVRVGIKLLVRREFGTFNYGEE